MLLLGLREIGGGVMTGSGGPREKVRESVELGIVVVGEDLVQRVVHAAVEQEAFQRG